MSTLTDRIAWLHRPPEQLSEGIVETGLGNAESEVKNYGAVKMTPISRIRIFPGGVIAYDEPLITADGAPVTATGPGQWGQLYAAGRY